MGQQNCVASMPIESVCRNSIFSIL